MIKTFTDLFSSKKFITTLLGIGLALAGLKLGASDAIVLAILGSFGILVGAQGAADLGKEAARLQPTLVAGEQLDTSADPVTTDQGGFARIETMLAFILVGVLSGGLFACGWLKHEGSHAAANTIDCASKQARELTKQLTPTFEQVFARSSGNDGKIDWPSIDLATSALEATAWCAVEATVAHLVSQVPLPGSPQSSPLDLNPDELRAGVAGIRARRFADVTFKNTNE